MYTFGNHTTLKFHMFLKALSLEGHDGIFFQIQQHVLTDAIEIFIDQVQEGPDALTLTDRIKKRILAYTMQFLPVLWNKSSDSREEWMQRQ